RAAAQGFESESTPRFDVRIVIEPSGTLEVTETIVQDFGSVPRHGIYRYIPDRLRFDDRYDRVYPIDLVSVTTSPDTPDGVQTSSENGNFVIRIGDEDREITGEHTYTIVYRVTGAMNGFDTHDELYWNAIGTDWQQPIGQMRVRVEGPAPVTRVACFQGPFGSTFGCSRAQVKDGDAVFVQDGLGSYTAMSVVVALPPGTVATTAPILDERWSIDRAFSRTPGTVSGAAGLAVAAVGGFSWLMWKRGRDVRFAGSQVDQVMGGPIESETQTVPLLEKGEGPVEFAPPENLRPGEVGTLVDEEANTLDVTATIVDLAVRKYLVIEEIPKKWFLGKPDWKLTRRTVETGELLPYERSLLTGLFEDGDEVELSDLKKKFAERLTKVKDALYQDVVAKKWFLRRPDKVRQTWAGIGAFALVAGIGVTVALAWFTHFGLLGVPFVIGGLLLLLGARWMPGRTAKGTAMTRRVNGFRRVIETAEEHTARWAEQENVFTRYLPYAVVFGVTDKWAKTFEALGQTPSDDMSWYVSTRPFLYAEFADSLDSFAVTTSGVIASTPSGSGGSGFGGGGFSGGGGGGGGGGSW
ncbi:MAG: DUF2207 domain-containing protein, partial [Actinomycetota bacterium]